MFDFDFQCLEHIVHDLFVIGQVALEPLQGLRLVLVAARVDKALELLKLLVGHLIGQLCTDAEL